LITLHHQCKYVIKNTSIQEKERIEEMQMQLKVKELDIEQFMLSKEKEERVSFLLHNLNLFLGLSLSGHCKSKVQYSLGEVRLFAIFSK
jgi:hypothetical protein